MRVPAAILAIAFGACAPIEAASLEKAAMLIDFKLMDRGKAELIDIVFSHSPSPNKRAEALYMLGTIGIGESNNGAAFQAWTMLVHDYPTHERALLVQDHLEALRKSQRESLDQQIDDARAQLYFNYGEFYNESEHSFTIDTSYIPAPEAGIRWYEKIISEFPASPSAEIAHKRKVQALLGWRSSQYSAEGAREDFKKYMPMAVGAFRDLESGFPESSLLQPLRFQIAQAYWRKGHRHDATLWLREVIEASGEEDTFYRNLAQDRLHYWKGQQ